MLGLVTPEEQQGKNPNDGKLQPSAEQMRLFRVLIAVSVKECQLRYLSLTARQLCIAQ